MRTLHDLLMNTLVPHSHNLRRWIVFEPLQKLEHEVFAHISSGAENPEVFEGGWLHRAKVSNALGVLVARAAH